jgi:ADP-ribosyl-[dinitrogen reductase] hydrolase
MSELDTLFDRALGAYLGFAIGDALGATVEFMRPREIQAQYGVHRDILGGGWLRLARGQVTDDTTMSLAVGEALLEGGVAALRDCSEGHTQPTARAMAEAFVRWWRSKPVDCGHTCRRGILRYMHDGSVQGEPNEGDGGNGALMRNLPTALATLGRPDLFDTVSLLQARVTHHHAQSDTAVLGLGQLLQQLLHGLSAAETQVWVDGWVARQPAFRFTPYPGRASGYVVDTVQTVLHFFCSEPDFEAAMIGTVNQGDDADTTGALLGMLAGARCGAAALPRRWLQRLQPAVVQSITDQTSGLLALQQQLTEVPA